MHTLTHAHTHTQIHTLLLTFLSVHPGDDLRARRSYPGLPERAQQASAPLLPRGDAEEPAETAGETSPGGAAEEGPAKKAGGGDGEEEKNKVLVLSEGLCKCYSEMSSPTFHITP